MEIDSEPCWHLRQTSLVFYLSYKFTVYAPGVKPQPRFGISYSACTCQNICTCQKLKLKYCTRIFIASFFLPLICITVPFFNAC